MNISSMMHKCGLNIDRVRFFEIGPNSNDDASFTDYGEVVGVGDANACHGVVRTHMITGNFPSGTMPAPVSGSVTEFVSSISIENADEVCMYVFRLKSGMQRCFSTTAAPVEVYGSPNGQSCNEIFSDCCLLSLDTHNNLQVKVPLEVHLPTDTAYTPTTWAGFVFNGKEAKRRIEAQKLPRTCYGFGLNIVDESTLAPVMTDFSVNGYKKPWPCPDHRFYVP